MFDDFAAFEKHFTTVFKDWLDQYKSLFLLNNGNLFVVSEWLTRYEGEKIRLPQRWLPDPKYLSRKLELLTV